MNPPIATAEPPASTAPSRTAREFAQFVTDAHWNIAHGRVDGGETLWGAAPDLPGRNLRELLRRASPAWVALLPARADEGDDSVFLPWPQGGAPGFGFALHRLAVGDSFVFTLVPDLASAEELGREGFAGVAARPDAFAQLFLRHCVLESRLHNYLTTFPGVVFSRRGDGSFSDIGPGVEEMTGVAAHLLAKDGTRYEQLIHEADREAYAKASAAHARDGKPFSLVYRLQHAATGQVRHVLDVRSAVRSASGLPLGSDGIWLDITRQKVAELRLNENGWKETLAVLTSGLLHDFGNLLAGIYGLSELYHAQVTGDPSVTEGLGMIKEHARQAQQLVKKISSLNRDTVGRRNYYSLNRLTREQLELLGPILPKSIKLTTEFPEQDIPVYLDEVAFRQALVNFALNARDAMGQQGTIHLRLAPAPKSREFADVVFRRAPDWTKPQVALVFQDSGCGIPADKLAKVFDPFYTTKQSDKGTGLGLYTSQLFAENEGGTIGARSTVGHGTEIVLLLPVASLTDDGDAAPAANLVEEPVPARRPCVLLHTPGSAGATRLEESLRGRDWEVRNTIAFQEIRMFLSEKGANLDLLLIIQPEADEELPRLLDLVRSRHPHIRIALEVTGQNPDEVPGSISRRVDTLLRPNRPEREIVAELARFLPTR